MKNNKTKIKKCHSRIHKKKKLNNKLKKDNIDNIIDETILFNSINDKLEKIGIYLLDLKVRNISNNKKVYGVIFIKGGSVSHNHCIDTTREIQECIRVNGYDDGDYTITISSAGFRWKFNDRYELFENMPIKIKYKSGDNFITTYAILKEARDDYIVISVIDENNIFNEKSIKVLKSDILKTRLNC